MIKRIKKRDGQIVNFEPEKISAAIARAFLAVGEDGDRVPSRLAERVANVLAEQFSESIPGVEDIQDIVERSLIDEGYSRAAKAYILYRQKRAEIREAKRYLGVADDLKLSVNAVEVLKKRYLQRDERGLVVETPGEMFERVAKHVSRAEEKYGGDSEKFRPRFLKMMRDLDFLPNSPTLMNAGLPLGQLSACFVLPVEDSLPGIFDALKNMALIHQSGGGTGFSFSRLRPKDDVVQATGGVASGPVSFMRIFDTATDVIKQGGRRRGANMGVLRIDHPDILEFIESKSKPGFLENFNISVAATDEFMQKARQGGEIDLINPRTGLSTGRLQAAGADESHCQLCLAGRRSGNDIHRSHQCRSPPARPDRGHQPLRRAAAASIRVLQSGVHQPLATGEKGRAGLGAAGGIGLTGSALPG